MIELRGSIAFVVIGTINDAPNAQFFSKDITLFSSGSTFVDTNPTISGTLNLFLKNSDSNFLSSSIDFIITGTGKSLYRSIAFSCFGSPNNYPKSLYGLGYNDLYNLTYSDLYNLPYLPSLLPNQWLYKSINLFTVGDGLNDGFIPINGSINFILKAPPYVQKSISLFAHGKTLFGNNITFRTYGVRGVLGKSITLYTKANNPLIKSIPLFTRGYSLTNPYDPPRGTLNNP